MKNRQPAISVLMPVYNAERFLEEALSSISKQTFKDFELLIINDGSTDSSASIIQKYARDDPRIQIINQANQGVGDSLIRGANLVKGRYTARMDADDIALPSRLEEEYQYLESHPKCAVIATVVRVIDDAGKFKGFWTADKETLTPKQISSRLPIENCIAHPSIMIRTSVLKMFGFDASQVPAEDYDLWLRLLSAGYEIHKLPTPLMLYRVHDDSVSQQGNKKTSATRIILRSKYRFLRKQLIHARFGHVERGVLLSLIRRHTNVG